MCPWRTISFSSTALWHGGSDECGLWIADCGSVGEGCRRRVQIPPPLGGEGQDEGGASNNYPTLVAHISLVRSLFPRRFYLRPAVPLRQPANSADLPPPRAG